MAAYTGVLAANTAVPAWHGAHRELPYLFAASATAAAAGMALVAGPVRENTPARCAAGLAALAETAVTEAAEHRLGMVAETYREGRAGILLRASRVLTLAGGLAAACLGHRRPAAVASGLALLAGSVCTRFGVFAAGVASAEDPKYTVVPQREGRSKARSVTLGGGTFRPPPPGYPYRRRQARCRRWSACPASGRSPDRRHEVVNGVHMPEGQGAAHSS